MICSIFANCKNIRFVSLRSHEAGGNQKQGAQRYPLSGALDAGKTSFKAHCLACGRSRREPAN